MRHALDMGCGRGAVSRGCQARPARTTWWVSICGLKSRLAIGSRPHLLSGQVTHSSGTWTLLSIRLEPDAVFRDLESCVGRERIREALGVEHVREHFDAVDQPGA